MAHYRKIDARIWNDAKFVSLSERGKIAFFFLLTHPNQSMLGAMRVNILGLASELYSMSEGYQPQGLLKGFKEGLKEGYVEGFQEAIRKGMVKYDDKACLIWLPNFLKYNRPESPNVVKSWPHVFDLLPECALKEQIYQSLEILMEGYTQGFRQAFAQGFGKPMPKTMPNQEQEQEQDINLQLPSGVVSPEQSSRPATPVNQVAFQLIQNNGKPYLITEKTVEDLGTLYPAVEVMTELRNMAGWLMSNPTRRKTKKGMMAFITRWLKQEQEKAKALQQEAAVGSHRPKTLKPGEVECGHCDKVIKKDGPQTVDGTFCSVKCRDDRADLLRQIKAQEKRFEEKRKAAAK